MSYEDCFVMGIAGNTPGHLSQVGETDDFDQIATQGENDPKCIFPIYSPNVSDELTSIFPISSDSISLPTLGPIQLEPEVALICDVFYEDGKIKLIKPKAAAAFNDCSIRIPDGEEKISRRKNWGVNSKGISSTPIKVDGLPVGGVLDHFRLCAFLKRGNQVFEYAVDSSLKNYTFFNEKLLNWIVETLNTQKDFRNVDNMLELIRQSNYPDQFVISIGAIEYTDFGESGFLQKGDLGIIVLYDSRLHSQEKIVNIVKQQKDFPDQGVSSILFSHH